MFTIIHNQFPILTMPDQPQTEQTIQGTNQNSKQIHVVKRKRGKTFVSASQMVLALLMIGRKNGAKFALSNHLTYRHKTEAYASYFDTQVTIALS